MSLFSRLRAVVSGDDYLDGYEDDDLDYDQGDMPETSGSTPSGALALTSDFDSVDPFAGSNVIGMPGISTSAAEVTLMEPRSFDEMPRAIQALRERKTVILNLTMMEPDQAQRAGALNPLVRLCWRTGSWPKGAAEPNPAAAAATAMP